MNGQKVILITGASSGMGKATALDLIEKGHIVYGAARRVELMDEIAKAGGFPLRMDITQIESVELVVELIIEQHGRIDVLWNNAGFGLAGTIEETSIEDAKHQFEVNIFGLANITKLVIPHMREKKSGTIINTSSAVGKVYTPYLGWYHATKHALEGWSDCLRLELAPFGINVVVLEPGAIHTEFGNIALPGLLERSGSGPYKEMVQSYTKTWSKFNRPGASSPVRLISDTIQRILKVKTPKTRYLVGKMAKPVVFLRKNFGGRAFDKA